MNNLKVEDIGELKGKCLLFGGVYSNYQALSKLREIASDQNIKPSNIICTGDILGYCAEANESIELIREWGIRSILGNVEIQVRDDAEACGCNFDEGSRCDVFSQNWYNYTCKVIEPDHKDWLNSLPDHIRFSIHGQEAVVVHGAYPNVSEFVFKSTPWSRKEEILKTLDADIIIAGHCGLPFSDFRDHKYWLNPGVIGMPANDGTSRVWYMILDPDENRLNFQHLSYQYDHNTTARLMNDNNLPPTYAETLSSGLWDNMEILNEEEKLLRGKAIWFS